MDRVRLLEAAAREQIEVALREAAAEVGPDGTLWLYFAGHGAAGSDGTRILLGDDARQDPAAFEARALRLDILQELAEGKRTVAVLDTCFSGSGRDGVALAPGKRFAVPTHATVPTGDLLVWTATSPSETSGPYDAVRHGAFTYFAVGALRGWADGELDGKPDGQVSAAEAQAYVRRSLRTIQERSQNPTLQGPQDTVLVAAAEPAPRATASSGAVPRDRDGDGHLEITEFYANGQLIRVEMDTNADGKPDTWEYYDDGRLDRRGVDRDMDGEVDQWDKTP